MKEIYQILKYFLEKDNKKIDDNEIDNEIFYVSLKKMKDHLIDLHLIKIDKLKIFLIHHYLDVLLLPEKVILLKNIFLDENVNESIKTIVTVIREYFNERKINLYDNEIFIMTDTKSFEGYFFSSNEWKKVSISDLQKLTKFDISKDKLNKSYIGFYSSFKELVFPIFKVRNMEDKRKVKSVLFGQSGKKI